MAKVFADDISLCPADEPLISYRRFAIEDSGGNRNHKLDRGETGDCFLTLRCNAGSVTNLTGTLVSLNPNVEVLQASASFGSLGPGDSARNLTTPFRLRAGSATPIEVPLWCNLLLTADGFAETLRVPILVGDSVNEPLGPDRYGYQAFDDQDITYPEHPTYEWVEIRQLGTRLLLGDDDTRTIDLPPEFGPLYYYGQRTTKLSICSNGWVAPDTSTRLDFSNIMLPDPYAPPRIIALLWDNFDPSAFGWIGYYHDAANHRFIVEYDSVPYFPLHDRWERFQIVFHDTTLAGPSGDNVFTMQYATANNIGSVTCGIQDQTGTVGLTYLWNNGYPRQSAPIVPGRAVKYLAAGSTAIQGPPRSSPAAGMMRVECHPNPVSDWCEISYLLARPGPVQVSVLDPTGSEVAQLACGSQTVGRHSLRWTALRYPAGVYFYRILTAGGPTIGRLVVVR